MQCLMQRHLKWSSCVECKEGECELEIECKEDDCVGVSGRIVDGLLIGLVGYEPCLEVEMEVGSDECEGG